MPIRKLRRKPITPVSVRKPRRKITARRKPIRQPITPTRRRLR